MAIGLEKWNELEELDITPDIIKKMRKLKNDTGNSDDSDAEDEDISVSSVSVDDDDCASSASDASECSDRSAESGAGVGVDEEENVSEGEEESGDSEVEHSAFEFCPICPGVKFLTEKDADAHRNGAKHKKREALQSAAPVATPTVKEKMALPKQEKPLPQAKLNRKARRANLVDTRSSQ
jgi:hypothetical protein